MLDAQVLLFLQPHLVNTEHALSQLQKVILEPRCKPHREEYFSYDDQLRRECVNTLRTSSKMSAILNLTEIIMYR